MRSEGFSETLVTSQRADVVLAGLPPFCVCIKIKFIISFKLIKRLFTSCPREEPEVFLVSYSSIVNINLGRLQQ